MKKFFSLMMALVLLISIGVNVYAQEPTTDVAQIEYISHGDGETPKGILIDSVYFAIDENGNVQEINPMERNWFIKHTVTRFDFYDMDITNNRHYYEVHMASISDDAEYYYTYHEMSTRPKGNSSWWDHKITHATVDRKISIGDSMGYSYPKNSVPSDPTVEVKFKFTLNIMGSYTLPTSTLSDPIE